jgi:UDP:flavonoid glycosyltransferase YjiC (YdhE family)
LARFLFAATPAPGHLNPALPIVRALVDAGHEVRLTTGPAHEAAVTRAGARFIPLPSPAGVDGTTADERFPARAGLSGPRLVRHDLLHLFTEPAGAQAEHLLALHAAEPADVLVGDTAFVGAGLAAERAALPLGRYGISVFPYGSRDVAPFGSALPPRADRLGRIRNRVLGAALRRVVAGPTVAALDRQRRQVGLPPTGRTVLDWDEQVGLYLQLSPPGFDYPRSDLPAVVHAIGMPSPPAPVGWTEPPWWDAADDRPLVVVTQGTVATDPGKLLRPALAGLGDEPVRVVAITARPDLLGPIPPNATIADFVPYGPLFERAAAVVTNGGFGGVQVAIAHGVPLVAAGRTEDKGEVCARVAWSGVGVDLRVDRPTPLAVRDGLRAVLADPSYGARARELAATAPADRAADRAASLLGQLARTGRPVPAVDPASRR